MKDIHTLRIITMYFIDKLFHEYAFSKPCGLPIGHLCQCFHASRVRPGDEKSVSSEVRIHGKGERMARTVVWPDKFSLTFD